MTTLSKSETTAFVKSLNTAVSALHGLRQPTSEQFGAVQDELERAEALLPDNCQKLWTAKLHYTLGDLLGHLVAVPRPVNDQNEETLAVTCETLKSLVEQHSSDPRAAIAERALGALASIATSQDAHDAEAIDSAFVLFAALLSDGTDESKKAVQARFFGNDKIGKDESAQACLKMLRKPAEMLASCKTHKAQFALVDVLMKLGGLARDHVNPIFAKYLKTGARLVPGKDFLPTATEMLRSFNDQNDTRIASITAANVQLPKCPQDADQPHGQYPNALIHFEEAFLTVQLKQKSRSFRYASLEKAKVTDEKKDAAHVLSIQWVPGGHGSGLKGGVIKVRMDAPSMERLNRRGSLRNIPGLDASPAAADKKASKAKAPPPAKKVPLATKGGDKKVHSGAAVIKEQQKAEEASRQDFFAAAYAQKAAREAGKEADADDKEDDEDEDEEDGASSVPPSECWPMPNETEESEAVAVKPPAKRGASSKRVVATQEEESEEEDDEDEEEDEVVSGSEYEPSQKAAAAAPTAAASKPKKVGANSLPLHRDSPPEKSNSGGKAGAGASSSSKPRAGKSEPPKEIVPHNGFEAFVNKMKPGLQMQHPKASARDIRKKIGEMWKAMDEDAKAQYKAQSKEGQKGKAPAAPKEAAKAKKPREVEAEEEEGRDEEDAEMIDAEKTLAPGAAAAAESEPASDGDLFGEDEDEEGAADEAGGVETVEKVQARRLSFSSTTKRNDGAGGGSKELNSMLGAFLEHMNRSDGAGDEGEDDEDDEMGEDDDEEEEAGDESMPEIVMPAPSAAAGSKKRPRSADPPPPPLDLDDDDDDDDDGHDVSGAMTQIGQMLNMILEKHQAKKRQKMAAVREQAGRDTKAAAAKADAEIAAWEEKMLARQKKQEAAVAAVHKALSTKLAGAQADGEAEARRVHERSESAVRKAVAELTAASHRSKSRLEEATKEILQQCAAAFRDIEKKKNDTLRKAKGGHKKALAQVASLISRMEAAGAASEGDMSD